ncbi:mucin-17-like [Contarinia nasturtii]|uniref:mucin-17-like n=1 Tax=Contarinia nasturtii TaxID=265458 RepID=UPI0012D37AE6|nr:mucin-17-like [Contarinia nasturtii]
MEPIGVSEKYYRCDDEFVYQKSGENAQTIYLDCMNEPGCIAGARFYKKDRRVEKFGTHSDEKPNESVIMRIQFEAFLKKQARSAQYAGQSVLNLYKAALAVQFKGIWLPNDHKASFLTKLRRIRKYEVEKKDKAKVHQNRDVVLTVDAATSPLTVDATTSPFTPNTIAQATVVPTIPSQRSPHKKVVSSALASISLYTTPVATSTRVLRSATHSVVNSLPSSSPSSNVKKPSSRVTQSVGNGNALKATLNPSPPLQSRTKSKLVSNGQRTPKVPALSPFQGMANATRSKKKAAITKGTTKKSAIKMNASKRASRTNKTKTVCFASQLELCRRSLIFSPANE